jgi:glutamate formiminotransferase/formiminotetrahydrofolate cyclodeaminase
VARRGQGNAFYSSGKELFYTEGRFPCGNCGHDAASFPALETHCREAHHYELRHLLKLNDIVATDAADGGVLGKKAYKAGLFTHCKAIGWYVDAYKRAQLSINLTNYKVTPPDAVLEAARRMAAERGLVVTGSEIVGLVPYPALLQAGQRYLRAQGKSPFVPVPDILENAVFSMGLADVAPFELEKKVLGLPRAVENGLATLTVDGFCAEVSRDTPAPGGGSIAALAGALGAGLASMVANLTQGKTRTAEAEQAVLTAAEQGQRLKDRLVLGIDDDTNAFNAYMDARRLPQATPAAKEAREAAMQAGLKQAVEVPWSTAADCLEVMRAADLAMRHGNPASITDALVGVQMGFAGLRGGIWNVLINLKDITDAAFNREMEKRCADLLAEARALLEAAMAFGDGKLAGMLEPKKA